MSARWWTLVVWAGAAASALAWGFKLFVAAPAAPPQTQVADASLAARGDLTRLLGVDAPPPPPSALPEPVADSRFQLVGVVSPRQQQAAREGLALIAVDGKPARAYRVGAVVEGQTVLQSVSQRAATLGPRGGPALVALNIAPPQPAATGALPAVFGGGNGVQLPQMVPAQPFNAPGALRPGSGLPRVLPPGGPTQRRSVQTGPDGDMPAQPQSLPPNEPGAPSR